MTTIQSIIDSCDAAIRAARELEEAKRAIASEEVHYRRLVDEKSDLRRDIGALKAEKEDLEAQVVALNEEVSKLSREAEEEDERPDETHTPTPAVSGGPGGAGVALPPAPSEISTSDMSEMSALGDYQSLGFEPATEDDEHTTGTTGTPRTHDRKRRVARAHFNSPKKWRRMIRTHRLQSILLREMH